MLLQSTIVSMAHLGTRAFDSIGGEVVSTTAYVLENSVRAKKRGNFLRLVDGRSEAEKEAALIEAVTNPDCGWLYQSSSRDFQIIPSGSIVYWASSQQLDIFSENQTLSDVANVVEGSTTGDVNRFLKMWHEVSIGDR